MSKYDEDVIKFKPDIVLVPSPMSKEWHSTKVNFAGKTTAQAKADGEFNALYYSKNGETFTKNKYGRVETSKSVPAIGDFAIAMRKQPIKKAVFLVEMHVFDGKLLRVSDFIHYLKGTQKTLPNGSKVALTAAEIKHLRSCIRLGFFQMISVDGRKIRESPEWQFEEMETMFNKPTLRSSRLVVLPWTEVQTKGAIEKAWKQLVDKMGYEGLVLRNGVGDKYKMKPEYDIDAVLVALNKNDGYGKKRGTSIRLAVMVDQDTFLEIGDVASGITHELRRILWQFKDEFGLMETSKKHYVQPIAVVKVECHGIFQKKEGPCWRYSPKKGIMFLEDRFSITMRHPKLIGFRTDKQAVPKDVGLQQIPRGIFENENYGE